MGPQSRGQYDIQITEAARLELLELPDDVRPLIWDVIDSLAVEPRPIGVEELQGVPGRYRLVISTPMTRRWNLLYKVDNPRNRIVLVYRVRRP